jgi:hypothetical protein
MLHFRVVPRKSTPWLFWHETTVWASSGGACSASAAIVSFSFIERTKKVL